MADRVHVRIRWATCPFDPILARLPSAGRLLDVGCGHGVLCLLAAANHDVEVHGVDIDADKLTTAREAADRLSLPVEFDVDDEAALAQTWDVITIVDVLYLLGRERAVDLLERTALSVAPGGVLVVKEMADAPRWKVALNVVQEHLAIRVLRITAGDEVDVVPPGLLVDTMQRAGLEVHQERVDRGYPHPHLLMVGRRPASGPVQPGGASR